MTDIDRYDELINAILPILDEIEHLKKLVDKKTFDKITKQLGDITLGKVVF